MDLLKIDVKDATVHFGDFKPIKAEEGGEISNGNVSIHYWYMFSNGFGASVIRNDFSYGGGLGLFEVAVIDSEYEICYDTPVARGVIGYLNEDEVAETLKEIEALPLKEYVIFHKAGF